MKKLLMILSLLVFAFSSCSKDKEEPNLFNQTYTMLFTQGEYTEVVEVKVYEKLGYYGDYDNVLIVSFIQNNPLGGVIPREISTGFDNGISHVFTTESNCVIIKKPTTIMK